MMGRNIIISNSTSECLLHNIEDYTEYVSQVLHDGTFLMELNKTMPFDKMVNATKNMVPHNGMIKKMGISVMRMDIEPSLYSLAITLMFKGKDGIMQNHSIFVKACKTIEELQRVVAEENFRYKILTVCEEKILGKEMALVD